METIELVNDGSGLGFGIVGGKTTGVIVKTILPGGIADQVIAWVPLCFGGCCLAGLALFIDVLFAYISLSCEFNRTRSMS